MILCDDEIQENITQVFRWVFAVGVINFEYYTALIII